MSKLLDQAVTEARQVLFAVEQDRFAAMIQAAVRDRREASCGDTAPKGNWARIAERIVREAPLDEECAAILREASGEFHEDFAFKHDLDPAEK